MSTLLALPADVAKVNGDGAVRLFGKWETNECVFLSSSPYQHSDQQTRDRNVQGQVWVRKARGENRATDGKGACG